MRLATVMEIDGVPGAGGAVGQLRNATVPQLVEPMSVDTVVDATIEGIENRQFLITPAPMALDMFQAKAQNYDGFLAQLQQRIAAINSQ